jgi:hypothetical protein
LCFYVFLGGGSQKNNVCLFVLFLGRGTTFLAGLENLNPPKSSKFLPIFLPVSNIVLLFGSHIVLGPVYNIVLLFGSHIVLGPVYNIVLLFGSHIVLGPVYNIVLLFGSRIVPGPVCNIVPGFVLDIVLRPDTIHTWIPTPPMFVARWAYQQ